LRRPALAEEITGCRLGAIPPFSFDHRLTVVADLTFLETEREIAFTPAGSIERSSSAPRTTSASFLRKWDGSP
jgi:Ala-tRNA(Pro) deacylase